MQINPTRDQANTMLAERLAEAQLIGLPAAVVAQAAGIAPSTLSRIVRGSRRPSPATAQSIARVTGVDVEALFPGVVDAEDQTR